METLLSVVIPAYNCSQYLRECVESVLRLEAFCGEMTKNELILVDDGSSDGTSELCDEIREALSSGRFEIRVIHQSNSGVSAARNRGMKAAKGEYLLFVDSDDTVEAEKLSEALKAVTEDEAIDMAIFGISFDYYDKGKLYRSDEMLPPPRGKISCEECKTSLYELYRGDSLNSLCCRIIRKRVIDENCLALREEMFSYEDLEFSLRLLQYCDSILFCREAIYHYRQAEKGFERHRLGRIKHLYENVDKIAEAADGLGNESAKKQIVLNLYLALVYDKASFSSREIICAMCEDYRLWIDMNGYLTAIEENDRAMTVYNGQASKLIARCRYTKIRHGIAEWIKKNIGDFRKW